MVYDAIRPKAHAP